MRYTTRNAALLGRGLVIVAAVALLSSCEITAPLPAGAEPFAPLAHYGRWWAMIEECSGRTRPMADIKWFVAPGASFNSPSGSASGMYTNSSNRIIIAEASLRDGRVVRHEMLHALLRRSKGEVEHDAEYFLRRCASAVTCTSRCVETSGPVARPPVNAATLPASTLELTLEIDSVARRSTYPDFAYVPVIVRARNPLDVGFVLDLREINGHRITFDLNPAPPADVPPAQWARLTETFDPMSAYFAPGETKTHVFDLYLPINGLGFGEWGLTGGFSGVPMKTPKTFRYTP